MRILYKVCAYEGDFPLPHQPHWGDEYTDLTQAIAEAYQRWTWMLHNLKLTPAGAARKECCVLVESGIDNDTIHFILGNPENGLLDEL